MDDFSDVKVSVIFATYNRSDVIKDVLEQWRNVRANTKCDFEIICSDDASSDNTVEIIRKFTDLPITILENEHGGASRARNAALKVARGEIIIFTGDDIFPEIDFVDRHYESYKKYGNKVCTLGRIEWHKGIKVNHLMHHITNIGREQFGFSGLEPYSTVDYRHFYTSNISIAKSELENLDEYFSLKFDKYGFEDVELGYRLYKNGVRIMYNPDIVAYHHHIYNDVDKFCNRQMSAGDQLVVLSHLHEELKESELFEIDKFEPCVKNYIKYYKGTYNKEEAILSQLEKLKERTRKLEEEIKEHDSDDLRAECSALYTFIFRFYMLYGWGLRLAKTFGAKDDSMAEIVMSYMNSGDTQVYYTTEKVKVYSEENMLKFSDRGYKREMSIMLEGKSRMRLDPSNMPCIVDDVKVTYEKNNKTKELKIYKTNSKYKGQFNFEDNIDSQIIYRKLPSGREYKIKIELLVRSVFDIEKKISEDIKYNKSLDKKWGQ